MDPEKLVWENDKCYGYTDVSTDMLEKECNRWLNDLIPLSGYKVFICKEKETGSKEYVLFDPNGDPVESATGIDSLGVKIDMLRYLKTSEEKVEDIPLDEKKTKLVLPSPIPKQFIR